jgi:hypothetical protein
MTGIVPGPGPRFEVFEDIRKSVRDSGWTPFTALVARRATDPSSTIELRYLQGWGVGRVRAHSDVRVALRLPDDRDVVVPAGILAPGRVIADVSALGLAGRDVILRAQLISGSGEGVQALPIPLASYRWSAETYPASFYEHPSRVKIETERKVYGVLETVQVRWSGIEEPARFDWIGVYPAGDPKAVRLTYKVTGGRVAGTWEIQPMFAPGKYDLRLFRDNDWDRLGVSAPFEVVARAGSLRLAQARVAAGSMLPGHWSAINFPHRNDWIGVFPLGLNEPKAQIETGGSAEGEAGIRIPKDAPPGAYEVRLYTGGWVLLSTQPVTVTEKL